MKHTHFIWSHRNNFRLWAYSTPGLKKNLEYHILLLTWIFSQDTRPGNSSTTSLLCQSLKTQAPISIFKKLRPVYPLQMQIKSLHQSKCTLTITTKNSLPNNISQIVTQYHVMINNNNNNKLQLAIRLYAHKHGFKIVNLPIHNNTYTGILFNNNGQSPNSILFLTGYWTH